MISKINTTFAISMVVLLFQIPSAAANLINNGDFETGNLSGWTVFTTADGTNGITPDVVPFNTTGNGTSQAAHFRVGRIAGAEGPPQGGGIFQTINILAGGIYDLGLDIATRFPGIGRNRSAGVFTLIFDDIIVDSFDFGDITGGATERASLAGSVLAAPGQHELRILITRTFSQSPTSPEQYVDNVFARSIVQVSEPGTLAIMCLSLIGLGFARHRMSA